MFLSDFCMTKRFLFVHPSVYVVCMYVCMLYPEALRNLNK